MGCAIGADQAGPVQGKDHWQVLDRHIVDQLVIGPLQEGGINRHHGFEPFCGQTGGKSDRMLLGNADIKVTLRKARLKLHQSRTLAHGRGDADQALILGRHIAQPLAKHLGESRFGRRCRLLQAHVRVKFARPVVGDRVGLGHFVALPFAGNDVQKLRAGQVFDVFQRRQQGIEVVPVNGTDVIKAKLLKQSSRHHHAFGVLLDAFGDFKECGRTLQHFFTHALGLGVKLPAHELRQVSIERAHRGADTHFVVVEDDQQAAILHTRVVHGLKGHAGGQCTVANNGYRIAGVPLQLGGHGHTQGSRNGGAGMRCTKGVVLTLAALRKAAEAAELAQAGHAVAPAGQDFVGISLVADIPDQAVAWRVKHIMQRHGQLHGAQIRAQMAAGFRDAV